MRKLVAGIAVLGAVVVIGAVAAGAANKDSSVSGVEDMIGVLGKTPTGSDRLPPAAASEVQALAPVGTDIDETVKARSDTEAGDVYLTATPEGACISLAGGSDATVQCMGTADLLHESGRPTQMFGLDGCAVEEAGSPAECETAVLYGVVPNGVQSVELSGEDAVIGDVENNVYVVTVPEARAMAKIIHR